MLVVAMCKFLNRYGKYTKVYGYECESALAKSLAKGDWLVVTNSSTVYTCARFYNINVLVRQEDIKKITQRVVLKIPGRHAVPVKQKPEDDYIDIK